MGASLAPLMRVAAIVRHPPSLERMAALSSRRPTRRYTLAFDVGGSNVKAALLGSTGDQVTERIKLPTPDPLTPRSLLDLFQRIATDIPHFDRIAVGIPGIVHRDIVYSLPASKSRLFKQFPLGAELSARLRAPVRVTNDAAMHGLATIHGNGVEMVITLGTGLGTALFIDGVLSAHYQTLPDDDEPFSPYGDAALKRIGLRRWQKRVSALCDQLQVITNYDHLYVGGGNAKRLAGPMPPNVMLIDNVAGVLGGHRLWEWGEVP
ncbi:MAG: ppgK [Gemmatimonadetes bacterium]|jgi:polyphosphate glucokinase|nr:ppgK [Gemmatimonadota bacterium]